MDHRVPQIGGHGMTETNAERQARLDQLLVELIPAHPMVSTDKLAEIVAEESGQHRELQRLLFEDLLYRKGHLFERKPRR